MSDTILDAAGQSEASETEIGNQNPAGQQETEQGKDFGPWVSQVQKEYVIDDLRGKPVITDFIKHYIGVKEELDTVKSGLDSFVKVPGENSTPEEIAAYKKAHGIPESADKYEFDLKDVPAGVELDEEAINSFKEFAFNSNLPPAVAEQVIKMDLDRRGKEVQALAEAKKAKAEEGVKLLKEKHGEKFNEKLVHTLRIIEKIGGEALKKELEEGQGNNPELINFLMTVSSHFTEDGVLTGDHSGGGKASLDDLYPTMVDIR